MSEIFETAFPPMTAELRKSLREAGYAALALLGALAVSATLFSPMAR